MVVAHLRVVVIVGRTRLAALPAHRVCTLAAAREDELAAPGIPSPFGVYHPRVVVDFGDGLAAGAVGADRVRAPAARPDLVGARVLERLALRAGRADPVREQGAGAALPGACGARGAALADPVDREERDVAQRAVPQVDEMVWFWAGRDAGAAGTSDGL